MPGLADEIHGDWMRPQTDLPRVVRVERSNPDSRGNHGGGNRQEQRDSEEGKDEETSDHVILSTRARQLVEQGEMESTPNAPADEEPPSEPHVDLVV